MCPMVRGCHLQFYYWLLVLMTLIYGSPNAYIDIKLIPRVLLTHIPLFRRDNTYCGPLRKSPIVNQVFTR
uniref:Uncharacterized protein n=1 Tax=Rhizophora mucronata TaxID=61149 RepID=A0A2P2LT78_RHIMU